MIAKFEGQHLMICLQLIQPLTHLESEKCKRCPSEFKHGKLKRSKEKEFIATFLCPECTSDPENSNSDSRGRHSGGNGKHVVVVVLIVMVTSTVLLIGLFGAYKYWQKRKRRQDEAQFSKLFEDGDGLEDELDLDNVY